MTEFCGEIVFGIHDVTAGDVLLAEIHWDVVSLVSRAEDVREDYVAAGWQAFDTAAADTVQ